MARTGGLSGQCALPCQTVTDTFIQSVISGTTTLPPATLSRSATGRCHQGIPPSTVPDTSTREGAASAGC
jgi:hypothetical protein